MRIISWNVNGIRAVIRNGFLDFLKKEKAEVMRIRSETLRTMAEMGLQLTEEQIEDFIKWKRTHE